MKTQENTHKKKKKKQQQKTSEARSEKQEAGSKKKIVKEGERGGLGDLTAARSWPESAAGSLARSPWRG